MRMHDEFTLQLLADHITIREFWNYAKKNFYMSFPSNVLFERNKIKTYFVESLEILFGT